MRREKIGFIGAGNMGTAIIAGLHKQHTITITELDANRRRMLKRKYKCSAVSLEENLKKSKIIIIAVKPQSFDAVLKSLSTYVHRDHIIVSIAAGITTSYIGKRLPKGTRVVRTMPNLPAQVELGMTGIAAGACATKADVGKTNRIFQSVGETVVVKEAQLDALTAVSGSGPAYVYYFMECLMKSATKLGLSKELSAKLVGETLLGSLMLLIEQGESASHLRKAVTSKGGTTQAAISHLEKKKFDQIINDALGAAHKRAKKLSK